jgi:hypothetical protein
MAREASAKAEMKIEACMLTSSDQGMLLKSERLLCIPNFKIVERMSKSIDERRWSYQSPKKRMKTGKEGLCISGTIVRAIVRL